MAPRPVTSPTNRDSGPEKNGMATAYEQRRQQELKKPESERELDPQQLEELQKLEEGQEISAEAAQKLAPQLGNQALAALIGRQGGAQSGAGAEHEEEEEQIEELVEGEDLEEGMELEARQVGGGGGGGADGGDGESPWDVGLLFGGEDDPDDPRAPTRYRKLRSSPVQNFDEDDPFDEEDIGDEGALDDEALGAIDVLFEHHGPPTLAGREGDALYAAVELSLQNPVELGRLRVEPEDLLQADGIHDPIGRPSEIGRFLAAAGQSPLSRALGRVLGASIAALVPEAGGYAGGVARLANLAVCAEALEGGGVRTDRAVSLSLVRTAWEESVAAARPLAEEGRLHALQILEDALGVRELDEAPGSRGGGSPSALGGMALSRIIPSGYLPEVPRLDLLPPSADSEGGEGEWVHPADDQLDALDALINAYLGDGDGSPEEAPGEPVVRPEQLEQSVHAARYLMNAIGRCQVEIAAAALAVCRVRPGSPVSATLRSGDKALRQLARGVVQAGRALDSLAGTPLDALDDRPEDIHQGLSAARASLVELRSWAFSTLAGAMDR